MMKKTLIGILLFAATLSACSADSIDGFNLSENRVSTESLMTVTQGEVIDLGLSVKWASCNVGATKPEDLGSYFAWGETSSKSSYSLENYNFYNSDSKSWNEIGTNIVGTSYDVARVKLGKTWRMPSCEEFRELFSGKCICTSTVINGQAGMKIIGPNGNSIFMPFNGLMDNSTLCSDGVRGKYWCGDKGNSWMPTVVTIEKTDAPFTPQCLASFYGCSVRAVQ